MDLFGIPTLHQNLHFDPHYIEGVRATVLGLDLPAMPETGQIFLWHSGHSYIDTSSFAPIIDSVQHAFHVLIRRRYSPARAERIIAATGACACGNTKLWAIRGGHGYFQIPHLHGDGTLSAVFYIDAGDAPTKLVFLSPNIMDHAEGIGDREIIVKSGDLIAFPSWALHYVTQYAGTRARTLLTFNIQLKIVD